MLAFLMTNAELQAISQSSDVHIHILLVGYNKSGEQKYQFNQ